MAMAGNSRHISGRDKMAAFVYRHFRFGLGRTANWHEMRADWVFRAPGSGPGETATVALWLQYMYRANGARRTVGPRPETRAAHDNAETGRTD